MRKITGQGKCKNCGDDFEYYRSPKQLKKFGEPKYCNEKCRRKVALEKIYFSLDELSESEKIERLRKSFEDKVIRKEGCWEWKGAPGPNGYLNIRYNRKKIMAHRVSWILYKGNIPDNLWICHSCDNRRCTNPDHLFLGTPKENSEDRDKKLRGLQGSRHHKAKLTEENVMEIKKMLKLGISSQKIAREFCVTDGTIWFIKHEKTWRHLAC